MTAATLAPRGAGFAHRLPFGANWLGRGRAQFRLWAPAQRAVMLQIEGAAPLPMQRDAQGWFALEAACEPGARYCYRLDSGERVPDPASRFQPDDVRGPSQLVDPLAYRWRHPHWRGRPWIETVIYELHVGLCGGFAGVEGQLAHLEELGATALELMPIGAFPGTRNWGYDGVLPFAPASAYGTPEQLKSLVDAAHGRGLMVFLDLVCNHFGPAGNFLPCYAPQFFREDRHTPWGAAIDFRQSQVRQFFLENALYWLMEYRFDGLRLDATHAIGDETFLDELAAAVRARAEPGRRVHLMLEDERDQTRLLASGKFDAQWNDGFHHALHVLLTGEHEGYYARYLDRPAHKLARSVTRPEPTRRIAFLQNHDQVGNRALGERLIELVDPRALRAAVTLLLLSPQIPLLFMGEDWGCRRPFLYFTDFHAALAAAVRDGRRREFAGFSAFADPKLDARIADPNDPETFRRSLPEFAAARSGEWWNLYRELLRLRREQIVPRLEGTGAVGAQVLGERAVVARWRLGGDARLHLGANFGAAEVAVEPIRAPLLFESERGAGAAAASGALLPFSAAAFLEPPA